MNENIAKNVNLKESNNPLNLASENENNNSNSNQNSVDSNKGLKDKSNINFTIQKNSFDEETKHSYFSDHNSESSLKVKNSEKISFNIKENNYNKKERQKLERKMKNDLNKIYKEIKIDENYIKQNNNLEKKEITKKIKYSKNYINEINKNRSFILKKLIIIQIPLLFLVSLNIILYKILNNSNNLNNLNLFISSLSLSCALSFFNLFLIILIILGIFNHYYTSNLFRFLCLINFGLSLSLIVIQIILIGNFKTNINFEFEKKSKKIFIYFLIIIITCIILIVNIFIGLIAKESLLIIGGWKNENSCPERKVKKSGNKMKGKYVYFNEEMDDKETNLKALRKFHACIYSSGQ